MKTTYYMQTDPNSASLTNIVTLLLLTKANPPITTIINHFELLSSRTKIRPVSNPVSKGI